MTPEQERVGRDPFSEYVEQPNALYFHGDIYEDHRRTWDAACAHKEAQRAGDDEVIRELAEALDKILTAFDAVHYDDCASDSPEDDDSCDCGNGAKRLETLKLLDKHATRIAAARPKGEA